MTVSGLQLGLMLTLIVFLLFILIAGVIFSFFRRRSRNQALLMLIQDVQIQLAEQQQKLPIKLQKKYNFDKKTAKETAQTLIESAASAKNLYAGVESCESRCAVCEVHVAPVTRTAAA